MRTTSGPPKRLIEADLPIKHLSELRNRRPPSEDVDVRRIGLWWSRKPQHQSRAIWLALLLPDPADAGTSESDRARLREVLLKHSYLTESGAQTLIGLRADLLRLCCELAEPSRITAPSTAAALRDLRESFGFQERVALDPFSGGGSIPVEAQRLGLTTIANEYNPIASLYLRALLEWGKRFSASEFDTAVNALTETIDGATSALKELYPKHPTLGQPVGYIRFRMLTCEGPNCGRVVPATSKFELEELRRVGVILVRKDDGFTFKVAISPQEGFPVPTMRAGSLTCPFEDCGYTTPRRAVAKQWEKYRLIPQIVAVVYRDQNRQLTLVDPLPEQTEALTAASNLLSGSELAPYIPVERWPLTEPRRFSPPLYGYTRFADCHTERQLVYLGTLCQRMDQLGPVPKREILVGLGALVLAQAVDRHSSFCRWRSDRGGSSENTFAGKSLGMIWDFFEADPLNEEHSLKVILNDIRASLLAARTQLIGDGTVLNMPVQDLALPDESVDLLYTDPPYYDQIPYSHLSDWPFVWMSRVGAFPGLSGPDGLVSKDREVAVDRPHSLSPSTHDESYFKSELQKGFARVQAALKNDGVGVVVFAHQKTSAWESLLEALLEAGFYVTASWPIETERGGRLQAQGTASLQSSIHLVVRPQGRLPNGRERTEVGEWREILDLLPRRIHEWMPRLGDEGIVGADAIFACLGPALEIFSRYSRVERASGELVSLKEYLEHIWSAVAKEALTMVFKGADASGFEEDARVTAMWLWTLSSGQNGGTTTLPQETDGSDELGAAPASAMKGYVLEYDAARKIAQGLGANLDSLASLIEVTGEVARLLPVADRTRKLFGNHDAVSVSGTANTKRVPQLRLSFVDELAQAEESGIWDGKASPHLGSTVLDRVHQSMILFGASRSEALKRFLLDDGVGKDERFWRLAQVLSYLYPKSSDEKRWIDGVLGRKKGLGL